MIDMMPQILTPEAAGLGNSIDDRARTTRGRLSGRSSF